MKESPIKGQVKRKKHLSWQPAVDEVSRTSFYDAFLMHGFAFLMTRRKISPTIHDSMGHLCWIS
jgi:hypothetical protein